MIQPYVIFFVKQSAAGDLVSFLDGLNGRTGERLCLDCGDVGTDRHFTCHEGLAVLNHD